jgi:hypothetical protein
MTETRRNPTVAKSNDQKGSSSDHELLVEIHQGDEVARQQLISRYQGLAAAVADSYEGSGLDCEALKLDGEKGLKLAIEKCRPILGYEFSSYALQIIGSFIENEVGRQIQVLDTSDLPLLGTAAHRQLVNFAHQAIDRGTADSDVPTIVCQMLNQSAEGEEGDVRPSSDASDQMVLDVNTVGRLLAFNGYEVYFCAPSREISLWRQDISLEEEAENARAFDEENGARLEKMKTLINELPVKRSDKKVAK